MKPEYVCFHDTKINGSEMVIFMMMDIVCVTVLEKSVI